MAIIVFGATGGIGSEVVRRLHKQGQPIVIAARNEDALQALAQETGALSVVTDATISEQVDRCFEQALAQYGQIDGMVHCVGSILLKAAHQTTDAELKTTFEQNIYSAFYVLRAAAKAMIPKQKGSIVLLSSVAAQIGLSNHEAIAAAKGAIQGLIISAAATYAPRGIRVNGVAPGLVQTAMSAKITGNEASLKASLAMLPIKRIGMPSDIASAILWLLSDDQSWVTGQTIIVDGGQLLS